MSAETTEPYIVMTSRPITARKVVELLSSTFAYPSEAVGRALHAADESTWERQPVGLGATVMRLGERERYSVSIVHYV